MHTSPAAPWLHVPKTHPERQRRGSYQPRATPWVQAPKNPSRALKARLILTRHEAGRWPERVQFFRGLRLLLGVSLPCSSPGSSQAAIIQRMQPFQGWENGGAQTRGSARRATPGWVMQSLWDWRRWATRSPGLARLGDAVGGVWWGWGVRRRGWRGWVVRSPGLARRDA